MWLSPVHLSYVDIPYASSINIELHYDTQCLATHGIGSQSALDCFTVQVLFDNTPLQLDTCLDENAKAGRKSLKCQY